VVAITFQNTFSVKCIKIILFIFLKKFIFNTLTLKQSKDIKKLFKKNLIFFKKLFHRKNKSNCVSKSNSGKLMGLYIAWLFVLVCNNLSLSLWRIC
jgi:hypothetical protein